MSRAQTKGWSIYFKQYFTFLYLKTRKLMAIILRIKNLQILCGYFLGTSVLRARAAISAF